MNNQNKTSKKKQEGVIMQEGKHTTQEQIDEMRKEILREKQKCSEGHTPEHRVKRNYRKSYRKRKRTVKVIGQITFLSAVLLLSAAIVSIQIARSRGDIPHILGFQLYVIESGSMEPTLGIGTVILCRRPKNVGNLAENDIITFKSLSGPIVTHRIVGVVTGEDGKTAFRTKGDNPRNSTDRELLTPDRVLGVFVAKIPLT